MNLLALSIGIGLVASVLFAELLGVASAGMIVPGYLALYLRSPPHLLLTLLASVLTYAVVSGLSQWLILYGRRRTAVAVLVGYLFGALLTHFAAPLSPALAAGPGELRAVIGFIIPGLIAIWMDRQGPLETVLALILSSSVVRLLLLLFLGEELPEPFAIFDPSSRGWK